MLLGLGLALVAVVSFGQGWLVHDLVQLPSPIFGGDYVYQCGCIESIRASGNRIPSIAVTAFARSEDRHAALASGYSAYFAKPIDAGQLARTVRDLARAQTIA